MATVYAVWDERARHNEVRVPSRARTMRGRCRLLSALASEEDAIPSLSLFVRHGLSGGLVGLPQRQPPAPVF